MRTKAIRKYGMEKLSYYIRWFAVPMLGKLSAARLTRLVHSLLAWKLGVVSPKSKPCVLRIEVSSLCNLRCPLCATGNATKRGGGGIMTLSAFQIIYSKIRDAAIRLTFYKKGEPMMNVHLFEMVEVASQDKLFTSFSTNFTLMKRELLEPMFRSRLDYISICLDGFSQETFERYRVGGSVDKVKEGIRMTMRYKKEHKLKRPFLNVYTITFDHVLPEMRDISEFCNEVGVDQLTFRPDESNKLGAYEHGQITPLPRRKCFWPWLTIFIDHDGSVYPCDQSDISYGNLLRQEFKEVWNGELYVETRRFLSGKACARHSLSLPCHTCERYL
jgi:radical SAM protein with 4Fe4S-binding SPASM domain